VAALLEVIRQITDMNKQGTKRGNTIIFVSFDLGEDGKLNITYLKL
jgi:Zn-dependent M28 family amino/carboxypeptidase